MSKPVTTTAIFGTEILPPMIAEHVPHFKLKIDVTTFVRFNEATTHAARVEWHTESGYYQRFVKQVALPETAVDNAMTSIFDNISAVLNNPPDTETSNVSGYDLQAMGYLLDYSGNTRDFVSKRIAQLMA